MELIALFIFLLVYLGMLLGCWPGLALDRTGIALLGAIAFIELRGTSIAEAASYVDLPALCILFSFMIISAQFYYSGFYTWAVGRLEKWTATPRQLMTATIAMAATLSALLINDIVCLALTPLIIRVCQHKRVHPTRYLIALACASNIGSALTLVGNPQNLLIGQVLNIPFAEYLKFSLVPCLLALGALWLIVHRHEDEAFQGENKAADLHVIPFDAWQSAKGAATIAALLLIFLLTDLPREQVSLVAAGVLLLSRRMASQTMLSFIDWQLLVLFIGLFIVNRSFLDMGSMGSLPQVLNSHRIDIHSPSSIAFISLLLSNAVSNVPAVMLLLPLVQTHAEGAILAMASTFAGNLLVVGSIANMIVIAQASPFGVKIGWKDFFKIGLPVTIVSFFILLAWTSLLTLL